MMQKFFVEETGAVTVDWVVLTAALVGLGLAVMGVVGDGVGTASNETAELMASVEPVALYDWTTDGAGFDLSSFEFLTDTQGSASMWDSGHFDDFADIDEYNETMDYAESRALDNDDFSRGYVDDYARLYDQAQSEGYDMSSRTDPNELRETVLANEEAT